MVWVVFCTSNEGLTLWVYASVESAGMAMYSLCDIEIRGDVITTLRKTGKYEGTSATGRTYIARRETIR